MRKTAAPTSGLRRSSTLAPGLRYVTLDDTANEAQHKHRTCRPNALRLRPIASNNMAELKKRC